MSDPFLLECQALGGRIRVANRAEGGAELTVELPRHVVETAPAETALHA